MNRPLRRITLLTLGLALALLLPWLRASGPLGMRLPDPLLLLLLLSRPVRRSAAPLHRTPVVLWLGLLRSGVTSMSLAACLAGFGAALVLRDLAHNWMVEHKVGSRLLVGALAAAPLGWLEWRESARLLVPEDAFPPSILMWRALGCGLVWALLQPHPLYRRIWRRLRGTEPTLEEAEA